MDPKARNQIIWVHIVSSLLSEIIYLQQTLLLGKDKGGKIDLPTATPMFIKLEKLAESYACDLAITAMELDIVCQFEPISHSIYNSSDLGRNDNWTVDSIDIEDENLHTIIKGWNKFIRNTGNGTFGTKVRELKIK